MTLYALGDMAPTVSETAFVHPAAVVIGDVTIGDESTVWPSAVLRGDYGKIRVGARTSVQDGTVVHATQADATWIGDGCVVGHVAHMEGCRIDDGCLVGSGAVVLASAHIGPGAVVGASAFVKEGMEIPAGSLAVGVPARVRDLPAGAAELIQRSVAMYVANGLRYKTELRIVG